MRAEGARLRQIFQPLAEREERAEYAQLRDLINQLAMVVQDRAQYYRLRQEIEQRLRLERERLERQHQQRRNLWEEVPRRPQFHHAPVHIPPVLEQPAVPPRAAEDRPWEVLQWKYRAEACVYLTLDANKELDVDWVNTGSGESNRILTLGSQVFDINDRNLAYDIVATLKSDGSKRYFKVLSTIVDFDGRIEDWRIGGDVWKWITENCSRNAEKGIDLVFVFKSDGDPCGFFFQMDRLVPLLLSKQD
jgi:hypothetical protein